MNWQLSRLDAIATIAAGGGAPQDPALFHKTGVPFIRAGSLNPLLKGALESTLEHISEDTAKIYGLKKFPRDTIVFAKSGMSATKGHIYRLKQDSYIVNHLAAVIPNNKLDASFLEHALKVFSPTALIQDEAYPSIRLSDINKFKIPLPPFFEQCRIADILDRADALRSKRRQTIEQINALKQSVFLDMFGDPILNTKNLPTISLSKVSKRITDGTHQSPKWSKDGIPFLFVSNIVSGEIDLHTEKFISDETHTQLTKRCPIELGDILYSTVGSYGIPTIVRTERKFAFQRHIAHIKPNFDLIDPEFLCIMLSSIGLKKQANRVARGVAQKTVNLADIKNYTVFNLPLIQQRNFIKVIKILDQTKEFGLKSGLLLDDLFKSAQHKLFNGDIRTQECSKNFYIRQFNEHNKTSGIFA